MGIPPPQKSGNGKLIIIVVIAAVCVCGIPALGIVAAIAVPAFTKYMRRAKTSEARVKLATMFDAISAHYMEHGRCPEGETGQAGVTPPLSVNCNDSEARRCSSAAGMYPATAWTDNPVWSEIGFKIDGEHFFHYNLRWTQTADSCQFTAQAFGDLDDDGVFSTFERAGAADVNGVQAAAGLNIDHEVE
ncbi:MAG: prepilin-type cleavage/methylation domain-containing protein [Nannocystaceae bacterium]|nr:prepilin-type cleavage/methylation domain-containing protein [Nannocystaceae bacterium]